MFQKLIQRLGRALSQAGIPYMIIGGQAVLLYGEPRLTRDIDITVGLDADGYPAIAAVGQTLGLKPLPEDPESFVHETMVLPLIDEASSIRVDFIFSFTPYERQAIDRARVVEIEGTAVAFAQPEDVIIHKIFAGRPRDMEDAAIILMKNLDMDLKYVEKWLTEFDATIPENGFLKALENIKRK